jgi:Integrase core domain
MDVLAGADFSTVEVLTWRGLVTYYVLFFIEVGSRRVSLGGITRHPDSCWMEQVARNATMQETGYLNGCRYLLHDRDKKFCREFRETLAAGGVKCTPIPARSPNLNAHAERWVCSIKEECLSKLILFGEKSLQRVVPDFLEHYHRERKHQDFSKFAENCAMEKRAIAALGSALEGSERPTAGHLRVGDSRAGRMATEEDAPVPPSASYPRASEATTEALLKRACERRLYACLHGPRRRRPWLRSPSHRLRA